MIRIFNTVQNRLQPGDIDETPDFDATWIDLVSPSPEEVATLGDRLGITIPDRADMEEIEVSSRLYRENESSFMTAILPAQTDDDDPEMAPVSFILSGKQLITVRYHDPRAFTTFPTQARKTAMKLPDADTVLVGLLEVIIDRLADVLERAGRDIDAISASIFRKSDTTSVRRNFQGVLEKIGRKGDLNSHIRDSLITLERLAGFLGHVASERGLGPDLRERIKTLSRDARSLTDHSGFLSQKITFMLDASLGMINIEQNATIKIFSVVAVIFLPPTLIASIYGMNFEYMPELSWLFGYPFAIGLMIAAAILPYLYFKYRGWL
ncbi:magnesium/cobalt transporter CorA [Loktanella sp. SALINAS62]|uniref:magnesium/cobalt transporter CorA n=1 Tax=Loktanella sp. SALINAS62 TaxID=2706124 RepID=UPI001B8C4C35|nr:magnesium/cobalt transporter CorA [Loktanella sp. SALINAS62]MBS1302240.1 magnesium/cobalt transporter CorA [Loktanella sp. SALINAS62]